MQSNTSTSALLPPTEAPTMADGAALWSQLNAAMDQRAKLDARIVDLTVRLQRSGTIEALEGLPLDAVLALTHRLPRSDRSMQITAGEVLANMPATRRLFASGALSWGQVRGIVAEARRLSKELRAVLDERIAASADLLAKMDPDDLLDQVTVDAAELRGVRDVEREERAAQRARFVWGQLGIFGSGKLYGEMDNPSLAAVLTGMDEAAPSDDGRSLSQRRADGLVALATHRCDNPSDTNDRRDDGSEGADSGDDGSRVTRHPLLCRATPAFDVVVDWRDVTITAAGMLTVNAPGCVPTISAALVEALAGDATVRAVVMDGARPLTVTRKVTAKRLSDDVRAAVLARDRGDRFPASRRPVEHVHHLDKDGAGHHVDALVGLSQRSHNRVHGHGWKVTVSPINGEITFTRGERSWTTVPRGTRLRRPPPRHTDDTHADAA